eukprot:sb/3477507/
MQITAKRFSRFFRRMFAKWSCLVCIVSTQGVFGTPLVTFEPNDRSTTNSNGRGTYNYKISALYLIGNMIKQTLKKGVCRIRMVYCTGPHWGKGVNELLAPNLIVSES